MFERYTEKARRVIFFARYEASQFGSESIETEHVLLGLFREDKDLAVRFLGPQVPEGGVVPPEVRAAQERIESIVKRMETAIARRDFQEARSCSEEERRESDNLRQLSGKYNLAEPSTLFVSVRLEAIRKEIEAVTERRPKVSTSVDLPLTHECKRVLAYAAEEAERLKQAHIETQHLLLGLLREEGSLAARILQDQGLRLSQVREEIARSSPAEAGRTGFGAHRPLRDATFGALAARFAGHRQFASQQFASQQFASQQFASQQFASQQFASQQFASQWMAALEDAGRVAQMARLVAARRNHPCIETTDLLLALTHEKEVTERLLGPLEPIRKHRNLERMPPREKVSAEELAFSEDCKLAFAFAIEEAAQLGQRTGPGHVLLGILRVEACAAAEILRDCGLTATGIRAHLAPPPPPSSDPEQGRSYV